MASKDLNTLPLILCGPIVRRVEPKLVAIWIALKAPAKVQVDLYKAETKADALPDKSLATGETKTLAFGPNLHIVTAVVQPKEALKAGTTYAYNLVIKQDDKEKEDLKKLGLLEDKGVLHLALGYAKNKLPSFVLPPEEIEDLTILHGSCRNTDNAYEDATSWIDDLIQEKLQHPESTKSKPKSNDRPHQLFLSGDQIYADSVNGDMLDYLTKAGCFLLGDREFLPTEWANDAKKNVWKANQSNFPAFLRGRLFDSEARFTGGDKDSHLFSFGEFASMYLSVWSTTIWNKDEMRNFSKIFTAIKTKKALPSSWGAIFRDNNEAIRNNENRSIIENSLLERILNKLLVDMEEAELIDLIRGNKEESSSQQLSTFRQSLGEEKEGSERAIFENFWEGFKSWFSGLFKGREDALEKFQEDQIKKYTSLFKGLPKVSRALANISTYMMMDDHEVTDDWNLNPLWRNRVYTSRLGKTILRNGLMAYAIFQDWGNRPMEYNRVGYYFEITNKSLEAELNKSSISDALIKTLKDKVSTLKITKEKSKIKKTTDGEWVLKDEENQNEFLIRKYKEKKDGKEIEIFKIMGNPAALLLKKATELFKEDKDTPNTAAENIIDRLLGLEDPVQPDRADGGRFKLPANRTPPVKWQFSITGPKYKVLFIDNRTRRTFLSQQGPPGNLSKLGMDDLIPANLTPKADQVLFVIAPLPVFGPSLIDELISPLVYRVFDVGSSLEGDPVVNSGMAGTNPDAIEAWPNDPASFEELLKRLAPFERIIILSGDIHFGFSQALTYWTKGKDKPARFAQFVSSGLRNIVPNYLRIVGQHFPFGQKLLRSEFRGERFGWLKKDPAPLRFSKNKPNPSLKELLDKSPVIVAQDDLPEGTELADKEGNPPNWIWKIEPLVDKRANKDRPVITQTVDLDTVEGDKDLAHFRVVARRHTEQMKQWNYTRQALFATNIGSISFKKTDESLSAIHSMYSVPPEEYRGETAPDPDLYTQHIVNFKTSLPKPKIEKDEQK